LDRGLRRRRLEGLLRTPAETGNLEMRSCNLGRILQGHGKHTWMGSGGCRGSSVGSGGYGDVGRAVGGTAEGKDVVQIVEKEVWVFQYLVHAALKGLGGVPHAKEHTIIFETVKRGGITIFWMSSGLTGIW
jgi:hypothetical protein